jgi:hypothetical protein
MILLRRSPSSRASWSPSPAPPLALPNRSMESEEIIRGLLAFFAERSSSPYSSHTTLQFLFSIRRASALSLGGRSVGCPGQRALVPRSQPDASITRMCF